MLYLRIKNTTQKGENKMLTFILKKEWFKKFLSGEKTTEYRVVKPYWSTRLRNLVRLEKCTEYKYMENITKFYAGEKVENLNVPCLLRLGYTNEYLKAKVDSIEMIQGIKTDLQTHHLVYAIKLKDIQK